MRGEECCSRALEELRSGAFWRDVLAELIATYLYVCAACALPLGFIPGGGADRIAAALGIGLFVLAIGWSFGDFSGAHMNPAITMTLMLRLKVTFIRGFMYWIVQVGSAIGAAYTIRYLLPSPSIAVNHYFTVTVPAPGLEAWRAFLIEALCTLILCFTVHGATNYKRKNVLMYSWPIGMALSLGVLISYKLTGGSLNPARSLGPTVAMMDEFDIWEHQWIYWAGPMLGAVVAAILYSILNSVGHPHSEGTVGSPLPHKVLEVPHYLSTGSTIQRPQHQATSAVYPRY